MWLYNVYSEGQPYKIGPCFQSKESVAVRDLRQSGKEEPEVIIPYKNVKKISLTDSTRSRKRPTHLSRLGTTDSKIVCAHALCITRYIYASFKV